MKKLRKFGAELHTIEVRHKNISTDDLKCIASIAQHYLGEMDMVQFCKVKRNDNNEVCTLICWTDYPAKIIEIFLNKYFYLWRWTVND